MSCGLAAPLLVLEQPRGHVVSVEVQQLRDRPEHAAPALRGYGPLAGRCPGSPEPCPPAAHDQRASRATASTFLAASSPTRIRSAIVARRKSRLSPGGAGGRITVAS